MGKNDSSLTRVAPVFNALMNDHGEFLPSLVALATSGHPRAESAREGLNLNLSTRRCTWGTRKDGERTVSNEEALYAPRSLLEWLIENLSEPELWPPASPSTQEKRRALARRDAAIQREALEFLGSAHRPEKAWWILEGPSRPDAYLETPDAIVVIEGKFTEPGLTTSTQFMRGRHQMLRHMDAAFERANGKRVLGMLIVEADEAGALPAIWRSASEVTVSREVIAESLPHRSVADQQRIVEGFAGVTTWRAVNSGFGLGLELAYAPTWRGRK